MKYLNFYSIIKSGKLITVKLNFHSIFEWLDLHFVHLFLNLN